jgi:radical SAM superfamily enzyme YgiQ (UPF0313 family)
MKRSLAEVVLVVGERDVAREGLSALMDRMNVALVSTFDAGMQPLALASAAAYLKHSGIECVAFDAFQSKVSEHDLEDYNLVVFSVPGFESLEGATALAADVRRLRPATAVGFVGTYAALNANALLERYADWIILGDFEESLVKICQRIRNQEDIRDVPGVLREPGRVSPVRGLSEWYVPDRTVVPVISAYRYEPANRFFLRSVIVGNVETTRGCRFKCTYCSVFAAYQGKVSVVPTDVVLADIEQVVRAGAEHICFVDAEFLNAPNHSLDIVRQMHALFPHLTFDFTSRADLIAADRQRLQELVECGATWVTSAFEFPKRSVLQVFNKGFGPEQLDATVKIAKEVGLTVNPTFVLFNPWVSADDIKAAIKYIEDRELNLEDVQFRTRLWLYKGSPLLENWEVQSRITKEHEFHYEWRHRDIGVEQMFSAMTERYGDVIGRCCLKC